MKRILILLAATAMAVLLFAPAALARAYYDDPNDYYDDDYNWGYDYYGDNPYYPSYFAGSASATASALAATGGLPVAPIAGAAAVGLIASGLAALRLVVRRGAS